MDIFTLTDSIKVELGHPVITLYITDEMIESLVSKAIRRCSSKASLSCVKTAERMVINGRVDLKDLNVEVVKNVYMSSDFDSTYNENNEIFGVGNSYRGSSTLMGSIANANYRSQVEAMMLSDYYQDGDTLYVDDFSGKVTIEYIKNVIELGDIDSEWIGWVESYSTALCKIAEGRIRGKFKPQNAPFEVESDNLVSEGQSTISELESKLDTSMGYFNILR